MSMLRPQARDQMRNTPVTAQALEERINMYISAMDRAGTMNDSHQSAQLQRDIQQLVDLMEKVSAGQVVRESEVPPPLVITPQIDVLANPLGELSSRLADYHKALYFAEEELTEDRLNKIQRLQRGLQIIHDLQKRAQAGFPVRADEVPPPVTIPSDSEFDNNAVNTLAERLSQYRAALLATETSGAAGKKSKIESEIRRIEFLMTRAKAKRPVWKKDIPPEISLQDTGQAPKQGKQVNEAKLVLQLRSLSMRVAKLEFRDGEKKKQMEDMSKRLKELAEGGKAPIGSVLPELTKQVEELEKLAVAEKMKDGMRIREDLALVETRISEYKTAAVSCKQNKEVNHAIQHLKVVKGLQSLKEALDKGESVDMTLVPPPPREFTPSRESPPSLPEQDNQNVTPDLPQGATACLSPVNIKPAVEAAEDKLAKKLSSYLDEGDESMVPSTSEQMRIVNNVSDATVSASSLLPKVQNSAGGISTSAGEDGAKSFSLDNIGMLPCENGSGPVTSENVEEGASDEASGGPDQGSKQVAEHPDFTYNSIETDAAEKTESVSHADIVQAQGNSANEQLEEKESEDKANKEETPPPKSTSSPSKSSEIYTRKTLDSVGFLSCQNVPEKSQSEIRKPVSEAKEGSSMHPISETQGLESNGVFPAAHDNNLQAIGAIDSSGMLNSTQSVFQESAFSMSNQAEEVLQPAMATGGNPDLLNSSSTTQALPNVPAGGLCLSDYNVSGLRNGLDDHHPSSITLPVRTVDKSVSESDSGPSSLPITLVPTRITASSIGARAAPPVSHISDIGGVSSSSLVPSNHYDENDGNTQSQTVTLTERTANDNTTFGDISSKHTSTSDGAHVTVQQPEGSSFSSPDILEFQDLMDSMTLPSMVAPTSLTNDSHAATNSLDSSIGPNKSASSNDAQNAAVSLNSSTGSSSAPEYAGRELKMAKSEHVSVSSDNVASSDFSLNADDKRSRATAELGAMGTASSVSQIAQKNSVDSFHSSYVGGGQQDKKMPDLQMSSASAAQSQNMTFVYGGLPSSAMPGSQVQDSVKGSEQHWNVFMGKPATQSPNLGAEGHVTSFVPKDVPFTCLENLKYDCLLKLSENTEESILEEKKLRAKFEQLKYKLRHGGKQIWEVYRACVEKELSSIIQQIEELRRLQQWSDMKMLTEKRTIAERELIILKERLPELRY